MDTTNHTISITNGKVILKPLCRGLKKQIRRILLRGADIDITTGEVSKVPLVKLEEAGDEILKLLIEKVVIDNVSYTAADLEKLNQEGKFTDDDWDLCEEQALLLYKKSVDVKKKKNFEQ